MALTVKIIESKPIERDFTLTINCTENNLIALAAIVGNIRGIGLVRDVCTEIYNEICTMVDCQIIYKYTQEHLDGDIYNK